MDVTPLLLVIDCPQRECAAIRACLHPVGWRVVETDGGDSALALIAAMPVSLVLLGIERDAADRFATARVIRADAGSLPILALSALETIDKAAVDGRIARPLSVEALIAAVRPWHPVEAALDRLGAVFGAARLATLVGDFRHQLDQALRQIDAGDRGLAHRIGGLAGTLGFATVSSTWLAVSEGDDSALPDARQSAAAALETIDRRLQSP